MENNNRDKNKEIPEVEIPKIGVDEFEMPETVEVDSSVSEEFREILDQDSNEEKDGEKSEETRVDTVD